MERTTWTDERLDDLARRMDAGFERVDADIRELRVEVREQGARPRSELGGEIGSLRSELGGEMNALRATFTRLGGGMLIAQLGMIAALIARG